MNIADFIKTLAGFAWLAVIGLGCAGGLAREAEIRMPRD
jgi:hypothetical protein